ncbi:alkylation response protein AidB-like acyl-CoA dehydrogenase [Pseudonocardia hierapolitana]|uniref:Alkylation response protein AidB-like acyl-CoA dehydrogenase n=1 Tax=Pseudonocardia hierapolitana TaxID=1128676 RepID=A0A561SQT3_9PSEU|nr:acyl-CoA dehydrogenase family protein [Pseudonocardia hierapolitana]TWF77233.1 alkylation response protein AidB-like acyl-CoA dehydrogenase [Pseudonocardia hierapolitana]
MTTTATSPLAALGLLVPRIEQTRAASAAQRRLPDELARAMAEAGLFNLLVPRALGGLELDPLTAADVVEAASRVDGSAGWAVMIGAQSAWFAAFLPPPVAEQVVGRPAATLAGVLRPGGRAVRIDGGYRVSGKWSFASGCTYADHLYGTCVIERPRALRLVYVPATAATVIDTWRSVGLRATGSHDFTLQDVTVADDWTLPMPALGTAPHDGPLYRDGYQNLAFVLQAAQALGVARGALVAFTELAADTTRWLSGAALRDRPMVQITTARAEAKVASARAWLRETVADVWATILAGDPPDPQQRIRVRLAITHGISAAVGATDVLQQVAGAVAVPEDHPLQRRFQDLRTAAAHVQAAPSIFELTGGLLLGADVPPSALL